MLVSRLIVETLAVELRLVNRKVIAMDGLVGCVCAEVGRM